MKNCFKCENVTATEEGLCTGCQLEMEGKMQCLKGMCSI